MALTHLDLLVVDAVAALADGDLAVRAGDIDHPQAARPGLYALHASDATWRQLGLGGRPDRTPLYIGKAEHTLWARDLQVHFGLRGPGARSPTGSSTLRRSLAALLAAERGYLGIPRNPATPGHFSNYGLSEADDADLSRWMARRLRLALWPHDNATELDALETGVLRELGPPLNLAKVTTPWATKVRAARRALASQARASGAATLGNA